MWMGLGVHVGMTAARMMEVITLTADSNKIEIFLNFIYVP
jgi:hypothetical protein